MPDTTAYDSMSEECRAAYEQWIDEALETGKATHDDVWLAAWNAGRASVTTD